MICALVVCSTLKEKTFHTLLLSCCLMGSKFSVYMKTMNKLIKNESMAHLHLFCLKFNIDFELSK